MSSSDNHIPEDVNNATLNEALIQIVAETILKLLKAGLFGFNSCCFAFDLSFMWASGYFELQWKNWTAFGTVCGGSAFPFGGLGVACLCPWFCESVIAIYWYVNFKRLTTEEENQEN